MLRLGVLGLARFRRKSNIYIYIYIYLRYIRSYILLMVEILHHLMSLKS